MKTLKERIENMEQELQKLKKEALQEKWQDKLVQPSKDKHYFITSFHYQAFSVNSATNTERKPEHAFKTREQAELVKEKMLLMQEMLAFAHARNDGWEPVWEDGSKKHGIVKREGKFYYSYYFNANNLLYGIAVKSREIAEEMLDIFRERIEKYYDKQY